MNNFPVKVEGKEFWISRSAAVVGFVFAYDYIENCWCVLANKRGSGTPDFQGYWNCPCGYLDFDETAKEAIVREVREETGLTLFGQDFHTFSTNTDPINSNHQNITIRHYAILTNGDVTEYNNFKLDKMETNEVEDVQWVPVNSIDKYDWAFGHKDLIMHVFKTYVKIPWYKKLVLKLYRKYFNND